MIKRIFPLVLTFFICSMAHAQNDSLLHMLNDSLNANAKPQLVTATFKGTHIVNMQTIESPGQGALNFMIQHRFGAINSGAYNLFGLDQGAQIRFGLDYGVTDRFAVGVGRSSDEKTFDGYLKYKLLRQTEGRNQMPISASIYSSFSYYTLKDGDGAFADNPYQNGGRPWTFATQLLLARKMCSRVSVQLAPTWIQYTMKNSIDKNDIFALGGAARVKITKRMSVDAEYNYLFPNQITQIQVHNSFSTGLDIETGGHVFQLVLSNSQGMTEPQYVARTTNTWKNGIYLGFNISRNFNITKRAKNGAIY